MVVKNDGRPQMVSDHSPCRQLIYAQWCSVVPLALIAFWESIWRYSEPQPVGGLRSVKGLLAFGCSPPGLSVVEFCQLAFDFENSFMKSLANVGGCEAIVLGSSVVPVEA